MAAWAQQSPASQPAPSSGSQSAGQPSAHTPDAKLAGVKKISVDSFGDDALAKELYGMIINDLVETRKFVITEWPTDADAILRGGAIAMTSEGNKSVGGQNSGGGGGQAPAGGGGQTPAGGRGGDSVGQGPVGGAGSAPKAGGISSIVSTDIVTDATLAMRLVNKEGTVIWGATKESKGANGKGPIEDVAAAIVAQLMSDVANFSPAGKQ
jgi:hypothetical protein